MWRLLLRVFSFIFLGFGLLLQVSIAQVTVTLPTMEVAAGASGIDSHQRERPDGA